MAAFADVKAGNKHQEIIGRVQPIQTIPRLLRGTGATHDNTRTDYRFHDAVYNGRKHGFELAGLFLKPICQITSSWVWGDGVKLKLTGITAAAPASAARIEHTDQLLAEFMRDNLSRLLQMTTDDYKLGDQYVIINMDGTLSIPSPDVVEVKRDPLDYRRIVSVTIVGQYTTATVKDIYTAETRTIEITNASDTLLETRFGDIQPRKTDTFIFDNLIGEIPVIHFACDRSADESNGRPLADALVRLLSRYDDLMEKALDGAETLSDPIPVWIAEPGTVDDVVDQNTEVTTHGDTGAEVRQFNLGWLKSVVTTKDFKFVAPDPFTGDIQKLLGLLFLLMLEHTRIPETVWGGELGQSRSSTSEQMDTFKQYIKERRLQLEGMRDGTADGLLRLLKLWLMVKALTDKQIVVADVLIQWQELSRKDEKLQLEKVKYAHGTGNLSDATMVETLDIVEDAQAEVEKAHAESAERADAFDAAMEDDAQDDGDDMPDVSEEQDKAA